MRGEMVVVRDCEKKPLVRRIWESHFLSAYVVTEETFQKLTTGQEEITPMVGFPKEDIFKYDENTATLILRLEKKGTWDWGQLTPWAN